MEEIINNSGVMAWDYRNIGQGLRSQASSGCVDGTVLESLFCFYRLLIMGKLPDLLELYFPYLCNKEERIK